MTVLEFRQSQNLHESQLSSLVEIWNAVGKDQANKELNELYENGLVEKRRGINGMLIKFNTNINEKNIDIKP